MLKIRGSRSRVRTITAKKKTRFEALGNIFSEAGGNISTLWDHGKITIHRPEMAGGPKRVGVSFGPDRMAFNVFRNGSVEINAKECKTMDKRAHGGALIQNTETIKFVRGWIEGALNKKAH